MNKTNINFFSNTHTANVHDLARVQPNYITLKGWKSDISKARRFDQLPTPAQEYIRLIEKHLNVPGKFSLHFTYFLPMFVRN